MHWHIHGESDIDNKNLFGFNSPSFVSRLMPEDGPAVDAPEADGSDASSLLFLLGGGP